jgi:hypothetical protein
MSKDKLSCVNPAPNASVPSTPSPSKKIELPITNDLPLPVIGGQMQHDRNR